MIAKQPAQLIPISIPLQGPLQSQGPIQSQGPTQMLPTGTMMNPSPNPSVGSMLIPSSISTSQEKITVPWGWKRLLLADKIVYFRY